MSIILDIAVHSPSMQKDIPCLVIQPSPKTGEKNDDKCYPSIYLLHGYSGDYKGYADNIDDLGALADAHQTIFICPDGGFNSWYFDDFYDKKVCYETFIAKELVEHIDSHYPTIADKAHRAISGLSMGGHGALFLAIRHPNTYSAAGSMSGGVDLCPFPLQWEIHHRLGHFLFHRARWKQHSVTNLLAQIPKDLALRIECGSDDFFLPANRAFHKKLLEANIPHEYAEARGDHNWDYWKPATHLQLAFFRNYFSSLP